MRALLDTNIIIHRENKRISNYSIGHLYRWLDKLKYDKLIHPYSIDEIKKYKDPEVQAAFDIKLDAYQTLKTIMTPSKEYMQKIGIAEKNENDRIDDTLLYEVYLGRVDILITEDRKLLKKAACLGLNNKVFSINEFITKATEENPSMIEYKMLAVEKTYFGAVDVQNPFFDSFRADYIGFNEWFYKKCDEEAYICKSDAGEILGFLYLKVETQNENYSDIRPVFSRKLRLKVGTFKVESTGFRLGERFIKIIFDNAIQYNVDEIYVTMFSDREELKALSQLLKRWGFDDYGIKETAGKEENILVKDMKNYDNKLSYKQNFPNLIYHKHKYILPIYSSYHTMLLPDSKLRNENAVNFLGKDAHKYALQKVYITWALTNSIKPGDLIIFYRMGETSPKKYSSVVTTLCMVDEIISNISSESELLSLCQNRSVFTESELKGFWRAHSNNLKILKFIFVKSFIKRPTLDFLWNIGAVKAPSGPRPFTLLSDDVFDRIMLEAKTKVKYIDKVD